MPLGEGEGCSHYYVINLYQGGKERGEGGGDPKIISHHLKKGRKDSKRNPDVLIKYPPDRSRYVTLTHH